MLQLQLNRFEGIEVLLDSGSSTLEKLYLENGTLSGQDINKFLDALIKGNFPKLNYLCLKNIDNINREFSQFSQCKGYTRLEYINKITKEYLALENDIRCQTKLSEHDTRSLIRAMLRTVSELDLSNWSLSGCLGDFPKSNIYWNMSALNLSYTNLCSDDLKPLGSIFSSLQHLRVLKLSGNCLTDKLSVLLKTVSTHLHTIHLEDTKLSISDLRVLSKRTHLVTIDLSGNTLTNNISHLLKFRLKKESRCPKLFLYDTKLSRNDVKALCVAAQKNALAGWLTLNLSKNTLTNTLYGLLKVEFTKLETLLLEDTKLNTNDVWALVAALEEGKLQSLKTLNLSENHLGDGLGFLEKLKKGLRSFTRVPDPGTAIEKLICGCIKHGVSLIGCEEAL